MTYQIRPDVYGAGMYGVQVAFIFTMLDFKIKQVDKINGVKITSKKEILIG